MGNRSVAAYRRALSPGGRCVVAGFTTMSQMVVQVMLLGAVTSLVGGRTVGHMGTVMPNQIDLEVLKASLEDGRIVPFIDRSYSLSDTAEAIRYLETGHARGKVAITVP